MPPFNKAQLSDKDMKDLVAFIRSLTPNSKKVITSNQSK